MITNECPPREELLRATVGALRESATERIEQHLETCADCLRAAQTLGQDERLIKLFRAAPQAQQQLARHAAASRELIERFSQDAPASLNQTITDGDTFQPKSQEVGQAALPAADNAAEYGALLAPPQSPDELGRLGGYRVLRVLGSGGMGMVFEAEDPRLKRRLALKVMKPAIAADSTARTRFLREAQTAASVEHDHIVAVYQVGEDRRIPFIAMPLLRGETLAERLAAARIPASGLDKETRGQGDKEKSAPGPPLTISIERGDDVPGNAAAPDGTHSSSRENLPLSPCPLVSLSSSNPQRSVSPLEPAPLSNRELARIGREIALGLAAAHERGLIHRDIKPSNIWLEAETGRVKILDFGLARAGEGGEHVTYSGAVLGTPAYMSPEQASGQELDARSDLFSLGCVLYHAATGRRPFLGRDALSTLVAVTTAEPPPPRELNPGLPGEINDLIVSLLCKEPDGRPQSAREVAERLAGWALSGVAPVPGSKEDGPPGPSSQRDGLGRPSSVQPDGLEKPLSSAASPHSNPLPEGEGTRSTPSPLAHGLGMLTGRARRPILHLPTGRARRHILLAAAAVVLVAGIVLVIKNEKGETVARIETKQSATIDSLAPGSTITAEEKAAGSEAEEAEARGGGKSIDKTARPHPNPLPEGEGTNAARPHPNARKEGEGTNATRPRPEPTPPPAKPTKEKAASVHLPRLCNLALVHRPPELPGVETWTIAARRSPDGHPDQQWQPIDLSPDGKWLACAGMDGVIRLIDTASSEWRRQFVGHDTPLAAVAFSPDGERLASLERITGNVRIWRFATGQLMRSASVAGGGSLSSLHWSPDGATLAVYVSNRPLELLDVASGEFLPLFAGVERQAIMEPDYFGWSPDGRRFVVAVGHSREIRVYDTATLEPVLTLESQFNLPAWVSVSWSPDGALLAAYSSTGEIRVWDPATGKLLKTLKEENHTQYPRLAWLPDSRRVLILTEGKPKDGGVRLWDLVEGKPSGDVLTQGKDVGLVYGQCLSAGARRLALQSLHGPRDDSILLFDVPSRTLTREMPFTPWATSAAWSPDSRELAVAHDDTAIWSNGELRGLAMLPTANLTGAVWSTQPDEIVVSHNGEIVTFYRRQRGRWHARNLPEIKGAACHAAPVVLSPNGRLLARPIPPDAASGQKCRVEIWDVRLRQRLVCTEPLAPMIRALAWTPDGALLAASTIDGGAAVYDVATGKRVGQLPTLQGEDIRPLAFSPDGKTLAAGYCGFAEGFVRLFDAGNLPLPPGEGTAAAAPATLKLLHHLDCDGSGDSPEILALRWSVDGRTLQVFGSAAAYVFDAATGERLAEAPRLAIDHSYLRPANFSPDGRYLAVATTCTRVWDLAELNAAAAREDGPPGPSRQRDGLGRPSSGEGDRVKRQPALRLVASVVPLGDKQWAVVSAEGHWLGTADAERRLVYVIQTAAGQETLSPSEFYQRFHWKNDPSDVELPE